MADETVDALVLTTRFDESGLDASVAAQLQQLRRFASQIGQLSQSIPPLDLDTAPFTAALTDASSDVSRFFAGLSRGINEGIGEVEAALAQLEAPDLGPTISQIDILAGGLQQVPPSAGQSAAALERLSAGLQVAGAQAVTLSAQVRSTIAGNEAWTRGLANAVAQLQAEAAAAATAVTATQRLALSFQEAGRQAGVMSAEVRNAIAGNEAWARGMAAIRAQSVGSAQAFGASTAGANRLRTGLSALAAQATGTSPAIASVESSLLLMGAGSVAVTGAAAGIALIGGLYNRLTEDARRSREELERFNDQLDRAAAARNPLPELTAAATRFSRDLDRVNAELEELRRLQGRIEFTSGARSGIVTRTEIDNTTAISRLERERLQILGRMGEVATRMGEFFANTPAAQALAQSAADEARSRERAAEAARRQLEHVLEMQHQLRVVQAGGGNLIQGAGGIAPVTVSIPVILQGAIQQGLESGEGDAIQRRFEEARKAAEELAASIFDVTRGLDQAAGAAVNIGLIDQAGARSIGTMLDLADSIATVVAQAKTLEGITAGGFLGLAGAGINLLGSLLGPSPAEQERDRIIEENNRRLAELGAALDRNSLGLAGLAQAGATAAGLAAQQGLLRTAQLAEGAGSIITRGISAHAVSELERQLALAGTNLEVFALDVERATGIEILDSKGRVVAAAFEQAAAAIDAMVEAATRFGTSVTEQQQVLDTRRALGLLPSSGSAEIDRLTDIRHLQLDALVLDPALEARVAALDLETEAGRQAFLDFQRMLFELAQAGQLTAEQLGAFESAQQLLGPIGDAARALDAFEKTTRAATDAMINVPRGFRQAALAFEAQIPGFGPNAPRFPEPPEPRPEHFTPPEFAIRSVPVPELTVRALEIPELRVRGGDGEALPLIAETNTLLRQVAEALIGKSGSGSGSTISVDEITIVIQGANKDGDQLAREIRDRLRSIATSELGDPDRWGRT